MEVMSVKKYGQRNPFGGMSMLHRINESVVRSPLTQSGKPWFVST